jgi:DNA-binding MarR family transcriptional regulator
MRRTKNRIHWLEKFVPYLMYRTTNHLDQKLRKKLKRSGINIARWRVLSLLEDHERMTIGEIVNHTMIEQSTISRIVDQLESKGLAVRETVDDDSRFVMVSLTESGESAFEEIHPIATRHQEQALKGFNEKEVDKLIEFFERIEINISGGESNQD